MPRRSLAARREDRALASSKRAGAYSRAKARDLQLRWAKANWKPLSSALGVVLVTAAALSFLPDPQGSVFFGSMIGAAGVGFYHVIAVYSGSSAQLMGDVGERWTWEALRRARTVGWKPIFGFAGEGINGDIDTVAIGPGGVFLIETKWSASAWDDSYLGGRLGRATTAIHKRAQRVSELLGPNFSHVRPDRLIVLWSPLEGNPAAQPMNAEIVPGENLRARLTELGKSQKLTAEQIDEGWAILKAHCAPQDLLDEAGKPLPRSFSEVAWRITPYLFGGFATVVAISAMPAPFVLWFVGLCIVGLALAAFVLRGRRSRIAQFVRGALMTIVLCGVAALVILVVDMTR